MHIESFSRLHFRYINSGILDESRGTNIVGNLVTYGESIAHIKMLLLSMEFYGGIDIKRAEEPIMQNNIVAGGAQACFITSGSPCDKSYTWSNNEAHSCQHGVHVSNRNWFSQGCVNIRNFYAWRNFDYGIMSFITDSLEVKDVVMVDNGVGLMTHTVGPSADRHELDENMHVTLQDSVIVGTSSLYDCAEDVLPYTYKFPPHKKRKWSDRFRAKGGSFHHTGVVMPIFQVSSSLRITTFLPSNLQSESNRQNLFSIDV